MKSTIIKIVIALALVWASISLVWFLHVQSYNKYFDENFEHLHGNTSHVDRTGDILYGAYTPGYLQFGGNFSCTSKDQTFQILLWPTYMCRGISEIGLILKDENDGKHYVYVDENMNYGADLNVGITPDEDEEVRAIMEEKQAEIIELYSMMKERFGFDW